MASSETTLVLYVDSFWVSPYALSCFVALKEKGVPFTTERINLGSGEHRRGPYAASSLTARVPALRHGDFTLSESSAIVEYLDDAFPNAPALLPKDLRQRARARQMMAFLRSDLGALREERSAETVYYHNMKLAPLTKAGLAAAAKIIGVASSLVPENGAPETAFGTWCIADVDLAMMLQRLVANREEVPAHLAAFANRQWQRPSVRAWVEEPRAPFVPY